MAAGAALVVIAGAGTLLMHGGESAPSPSKPAATAPIAEPTTAAVAAAPAATHLVSNAAPNVAKPAEPKTRGGVVADVPLFGPTAMATMEPAPLEPPSEEIPQEPEDADEAPGAPDEAFQDPPAAKVQMASDSASEQVVEPWGTGKLHLPFVHRIKLDGAATALEGTKKSNGFSVFIPKHKLLESGKSIARRDDRILEVRTSNEPGGARVTFVFQGKVPGYKVRLKKNYIEFFISSTEKS